MRSAIRILRVIGSTNPAFGGPIEGIRQITGALSDLNCRTTIATTDPQGAPWIEESGLDIVALGTKTKRYVYSPLLRDWLTAHAREFDVVVQHGLWNYTAYATWSAMRIANTPYLVYPHGMLDPWFRQAYPFKHALKQISWWLSEGRLLRDAAAVLFTSDEEKVLARRAFWPSDYKELVVRYGTAGAPSEYLSNDPQCSERGRPFLLFLGRIHPKKGCDIAIEAFANIAKRWPDIDLVIAGPDQAGWEKELRLVTKKLGIVERVFWHGPAYGPDKWTLMRDCTAFILPSHQENFGIAVAEAMSAGRPVLISDKVNIWREVYESGSGLVGSDNVDGFRKVLECFLMCSDEERSKMGAKGREFFMRSFQIGRVAEALLEVMGTIERRIR